MVRVVTTRVVYFHKRDRQCFRTDDWTFRKTYERTKSCTCAGTRVYKLSVAETLSFE